MPFNSEPGLAMPNIACLAVLLRLVWLGCLKQ